MDDYLKVVFLTWAYRANNENNENIKGGRYSTRDCCGKLIGDDDLADDLMGRACRRGPARDGDNALECGKGHVCKRSVVRGTERIMY